MDNLCYAVEPGLLFGRPGPNISRWDLAGLKRKGLAVVVSLVQIEKPDEVTSAGLIHYFIRFEEKLHLPYKTANGFLFDILDEFDRVVDAHLPKNEPMLIHCNKGKARTAFLLAYYLITRKSELSRAIISTVLTRTV